MSLSSCCSVAGIAMAKYEKREGWELSLWNEAPGSKQTSNLECCPRAATSPRLRLRCYGDERQSLQQSKRHLYNVGAHPTIAAVFRTHRYHSCRTRAVRLFWHHILY